MATDFIAAALQQAEQSTPPVRAAALMWIARVQSVSDVETARETWKRGVDLARGLEPRDRDALLGQARLMAAAIDPALLAEVPVSKHERGFRSYPIGEVMFQHGHSEQAVAYAIDYPDDATYPFFLISTAMRKCDDPDRRRAMLRRAAAAWRSSRNHEFVPVFQREWKALPEDEASDLARAIVHDAIEKPDQPIQASYCDQVFFTSFRENTLFSIVHVLRHLDRLFADELIALHPPLAAGVKRYPFGVETMHEEARARSQKRSPDAPPGFFMMGNPSDFPYLRSLMQAERDEDYGPPMEYALERYREDSDPENPNLAPKEFWAATSGFRSILYRSRDAALLEKIPDPDLRLFAQIELAAALVGLPELLGSQRAYRPRPKSPATAAIT